MTPRSGKAKLFRLIGSVCIGGAVFFAGLIVYRLWISNFFSERAADSARTELLESWGTSSQITNPLLSSPSTIAPTEVKAISAPTDQEAFALLYIPRIGNDVWATPIFEGVKSKQLNSGIGHYPNSGLPGQDGNFSLFGHRSSYGQPFSHIERLRVGDEVIVETKEFFFVYTLKYDKIVKPSATWVTEPTQMDELEIAADDPYRVITLITCEPRWSITKRWVWWGVLDAVYPRDTPPSILAKPQP